MPQLRVLEGVYYTTTSGHVQTAMMCLAEWGLCSDELLMRTLQDLLLAGF